MIPLERYGFRGVTQLVLLQREVGASLDTLAPLLRWSSWPDEPTPEQLNLLLATHERTLDCPELNDARTAEILAGFRAEPSRTEWYPAPATKPARRGRACYSFEPGEDEALELSYLGLIPSARGRGLANAIIRFAEHVASTAGFPALSVSVDARNAPAMKLYARHGFVEYDRREVWLATWPA